VHLLVFLGILIISYSVCVSVDLIIQHAMSMRRIISSPVVCVPLLHVSLVSGKRHDFQKNDIEY
jgi:hypothetical protein